MKTQRVMETKPTASKRVLSLEELLKHVPDEIFVRMVSRSGLPTLQQRSIVDAYRNL